MTLSIDGFIVTGSPEEIYNFIKLYKDKQNTFNYAPLYTVQPSTFPNIDPNKWTVTCECNNKKDTDNYEVK